MILAATEKTAAQSQSWRIPRPLDEYIKENHNVSQQEAIYVCFYLTASINIHNPSNSHIQNRVSLLVASFSLKNITVCCRKVYLEKPLSWYRLDILSFSYFYMCVLASFFILWCQRMNIVSYLGPQLINCIIFTDSP